MYSHMLIGDLLVLAQLHTSQIALLHYSQRHLWLSKSDQYDLLSPAQAIAARMLGVRLTKKLWSSSRWEVTEWAYCLLMSEFFPKQFTVGVLNATLDLAALGLVGVVGFLGSEVVLSPVVSGCLPSCGGWVLVGVAAFLGSAVVLSPVVSGCLPSCGGWVLVGVAASRTKTFRNQNHRFQFKFAYCKLFGVYAGVILPTRFLNRGSLHWKFEYRIVTL